MNDHKTLAIIAAVIAVVALVAAGVFFGQNQRTQKALTQAEKDLIYYKNTDLGKEVELLNLKLKNAERDLAISQKDAATAEARVKTLEANLAKIPAYLATIDAVEALLSDEGPTAAKLAAIDTKVNALNDTKISSKWYGTGRTSVDLERRSWGPGVYETVTALTARVEELINVK